MQKVPEEKKKEETNKLDDSLVKKRTLPKWDRNANESLNGADLNERSEE